MEYNAIVEFEGELSDEQIEEALDRLEGFGPAIGVEPNGRSAVTLTLDVESLDEAAVDGVRRAQDALRRQAVAVEVLATAEFDARAGV